jgi:hypothetical protein
VEVNIKMSVAMHFYTGMLQNTVFHKDQFKVSYIFFIYMSDCSKPIHGVCVYKPLLLANDTD